MERAWSEDWWGGAWSEDWRRGAGRGARIGEPTHSGFLAFPFQFMVVGVFGNNPEPAIAVDAVSIAPCGGENRALGTPG